MANPPKPTILITGGARRIGAALARHFAQNGYHIALHYRHSETEAKALANEIDATLFQANLLDTNAAKNLIAEVTAQCPNLTTLINNASTFRRAHLAESSDASIAEDLAINLSTPLNLMREFAASVPNGSIINMVDTAIHTTHPAYFAYLIAKKGLSEATLMAAREYNGRVRVNALCLGHILPTEGDDAYEPKHQPVKPTVQQVVDAAYLLATNTSYIGQILKIDGGQSVL